MPQSVWLFGRLEYPVDIGKRYDLGLDFAPDGNVLLMWVDLQHNASDGLILAFYPISVVLLVGAYSEMDERAVQHG